MSQLIIMRQRIKAIETIKKITHAMRLISMSSHSRMRNKQQPLSTYIHELSQLFSKLQQQNPSWKHHIMHPEKINERELLIVIGSQKGLCGSFNSNLFSFLSHQLTSNTIKNPEIIVIGRKAVEFIDTLSFGRVIQSHPVFTNKEMPSICAEIIAHIFSAIPYYTQVTIVSNKVRGFFFQKPTLFTLIPFKENQGKFSTESSEGYQWEVAPVDLLDSMAQQYVEAHLQHILFESLLAEQAARFISMDNSTRSAEKLLEETRLQYNKLRQTKITKELTELASSF